MAGSSLDVGNALEASTNVSSPDIAPGSGSGPVPSPPRGRGPSPSQVDEKLTSSSEEPPPAETPPPPPPPIAADAEADAEADADSDPDTSLPALYPVQSHVEKPQSLLHEIAFVSILCMAQLMTQASLGQTIAPLHIIGKSFGTNSPGELSWFASAYSLTVGTFILIAGRLGDVYGHKSLFTAGFLWFGVWSLLAGFAVYSNVVFFDCCRALQGIGPAFVLPNAIAILGRTYEPGRRKEMVFCLFGATAPSGFVFGAVFASLFAEFVWWPWAFWVSGVVCFGLAVIGIFVIPRTPRPVFEKSDSTSMTARVDVLGSITGVMALVLINFAWNQGPVVGWETPYVYAMLILGFVFLGIFAFVESRARFPLLPFSTLSSDTAFVLGCIAAGWSSFGIWVFYTWQFLQELRLVSPLLGSAQFAPCIFSGLCAAVTTGLILHRLPASFVMMVSMMAFMVGLILVATAPIGQTYWAQVFLSTVIMPWGMDMSFPAATILLSDKMPKQYQGVAASLVNTVVNYSISIGLGFAGTIESQINPGGTTQSQILRGYRGAFYMGIGLSGLGVMIAFWFGVTQSARPKKLTEAKDEETSTNN